MKRPFSSLTGLFVLAILILLTGIVALAVALNTKKDNPSTSSVTDSSSIISISYPPVTLEPAFSENLTGEDLHEPLSWSPKAISDEYEVDGQTLVFSSIHQPYFVGGDATITNAINQTLGDYCLAFATIKSETKILANEDYARALQLGNEFEPYEFAADYRSVYQRGNTLSILFQVSKITGIASAEISYEALTFDLRTGETVNLSSLLCMSETEAIDYVYTVFSQVIDSSPSTYYEGVKNELSAVIDLNDFYLDDNGLTIFFNAEIISPRVYGIRSFVIPYKNL